MKRFLRTVSLLVLFGAGLDCESLRAQFPATQLRIRAVDASGLSANLARAEVFLSSGESGTKIPLPVDGASVAVPLDRRWLCEAWPESCDDPFVEARLLLQTEHSVPFVSRPFLWMGPAESPEQVAAVEVRFPNAAGEVIEPGQSKELAVFFRPPAPRLLRLINQRGEPLPGVGVRVSLLLSHSNPCGATEGEPLADTTSDDSGSVALPDAVAEYALEFTKDHHVLVNPANPEFPMRWTGAFSEPVGLLIFRELEKRPLQLQFAGSEELAGWTLSACPVACPCGTCCRPIGETDASGSVRLEEFYPEEYERLRLLDRQGRMLWESTPRTAEAAGVIQLPKTPPELSLPVPLERRR